MEPEGSSYDNSFFNITICIRDDEEHFHFQKLAIIYVNDCSDLIDCYKPEYLENPCTSYTKPFEIHIDGYSDYIIQEEVEEVESDSSDEEEEPPKPPKPIEESFRTDTYVICLDKEPNILFTDCNHICMCLECEKN